MTAQLMPDEAAFDFNPMTSPHREDPACVLPDGARPAGEVQPVDRCVHGDPLRDLVAVLDDPQTYSSKAALPMIYDSPPEVVAVLKAGHVPETTMVVNEDEPEHIRSPPGVRRRVHRRAGAGHGSLMRESAATLIYSFVGMIHTHYLAVNGGECLTLVGCDDGIGRADGPRPKRRCHVGPDLSVPLPYR